MFAGVGNFTNTLVLLILFLCYDTYHPLNGIKTTTYVTARLDGVRPAPPAWHSRV